MEALAETSPTGVVHSGWLFPLLITWIPAVTALAQSLVFLLSFSPPFEHAEFNFSQNQNLKGLNGACRIQKALF